jgi:hypothetical protein
MTAARLVTIALIAGLLCPTGASPAFACDAGGSFNEADAICHEGAEQVDSYVAKAAHLAYEYKVVQDCKAKGDAGVCRRPKACVSSSGTRGTLYFLQRREGGGPWTTVMNPCLTASQADQVGGITPGMVATAWQRLSWPTGELTIQPPDGQTLVDLDTNFLTTNTRPTTQVVTLLGQRVTIEATPSRYHWHFGDGATTSTTSPGHRYPHLDVTHDYADPGHLRCSVDVTYTGRFRVNDDPWQQIPGALTVDGDDVPLWVRTASPVLTG